MNLIHDFGVVRRLGNVLFAIEHGIPCNNRQYVSMKKEFKHRQFVVTNEEKYVAIVNENGPIGTIHWAGAKAYCLWLCSISTLVFRLPTESEWEYTTRI